ERILRGEQASLAAWWQQFDDPVLTELIERSARANKTLQQAVARIDEARALAGVARGERYPQIDAFAKYDRLRASEETADAGPKSESVDNYAFGLDASWEIDVFGRIRRSVEAAEAGWQASVEDYRAVSVSLFAEVASTYIELRTLEARLAVARENAIIQAESLALARARFEAELVSELDVTQAQTLLADTRATIPSLEEAAAKAVNRLSVLLGEQPGGLTTLLDSRVGVPIAPRHLFISTPGDVIRQRPDIRRAERALAEQTARVGVATADLYPRLSIAGSFAFEADSFGNDLFDIDARSWSVGPRVRVPLFNGNRLRSIVDAEDARARGAVAAYEQSVLNGLEEAENAIVAVVRERERVAALAMSVGAAERSTALAEELYRTGLTGYQRVLDAQRALFGSQDALIASQGRRAANVVDLYRAFGGGWASADDVLLSQGDTR
ncbi:MAG: efflux transporter outer membrane subunit, partial [Planctomycetota bacterium]